MPKFLVISYDTDEQQSFLDFVEAADSDTAEQIVDDVRDYALVVTSMESAELTRFAGQLKRTTKAHKTRASLADSIDQEWDVCRVCGCEDKNEMSGGDGFDGLCPSCADKANEIEESEHCGWENAVEKLLTKTTA